MVKLKMFKIRTTKPVKGNKFYTRKASGGYSPCIKGKPTDACDVLANCVGYADGRFNEIYSELTGFEGMKYPNLNCNAENFIERAKSYGLEISKIPVKGGIMVWQKGTLSSQDGAGHVAPVEEILSFSSPNVVSKIYTSESGYNNKAFWNSIRTNNNGRWGSGSAYKFRGCIVNPSVKMPAITHIVNRDTTKNQLKLNEGLNIRLGIETTSESIGFVNKGAIFNWYAKKEGKSSYWYAINEEQTQWLAGTGKNGYAYCDIYIGKKPTPIDTFKVGDKVKPIKLVNYDGKHLVQYDEYYYITKLVGDKATLSAKRNNKYIVWAILNTNNIKKIG